ncbi:hypothetical protein [Acetonema longum]|uniref:Uncharacterized protein n=1 Tax=Acetonema longum DSM 6540 TaxID=1009370 RepID=F7NID4_9FIRM|nr:hypothetical protein [Acetonema longum]EGO64164.1 hypothetical protein ALO_09184 [Acetonema longum DSM 6540]
MAYEIGTANSHRELLDKIRNFVSNEEIHGSQAWAIQRDTATELILKGPGDTGQDEIYVGFEVFEDAVQGYYNLRLNGFIGYDEGLPFSDQPGGIPSYQPQLPLISGSQMKYWIVANGRRIIAVAKIGTQYEAAYLGLLHPYGTEGQYPYPLAIGGSMTGQTTKYTPTSGSGYTQSPSEDYKYTQRQTDHRHFVDPGTARGTLTTGALRVRRIDGKWPVYHNYHQSYSQTSSGGVYSDILSSSLNGYFVWPGLCGSLSNLLQNMDGIYQLFPFALAEKPDNNTIGQFDGCYWITGRGLAAEDELMIDADRYIAVPNVWRADPGDFWALKLS